MEERMVRIEELAMILDINVLTIERWYRFKRQNPDNEIISLLPDYILRPNSKNRSVRFWRISDIDRFKDLCGEKIRVLWTLIRKLWMRRQRRLRK